MKKILYGIAVVGIAFLCLKADSCDVQPTSDETQHKQQEQMLKEATAQTGMPNIVNFRERKLLKDILELRDQDGLVTYTYTFSEMTGKTQFFCSSIGYGIPYATQYTNPERPAKNFETEMPGNITLPQADPNGLFSPAEAEGTWVMCLNPESKKAQPVYIEPRVIVSPFPLQER